MSSASRQNPQQEIDELFKMLENAIRLHRYEADDLLYMIADLAPVNTILATAISKHAADFINAAKEEHSWTDIVVEAYRRALFDINYSALYQTDYLVRDLRHMRDFVTQYIRNHTLNEESAFIETTLTKH